MAFLSRRLLFGLPLPFLAAARTQAAEPPASRPTVPASWLETQLYFGTSKGDGGVVSDDEFAGFLNEVVTPRFPDGLTLLAGYGQFRIAPNQIVKEKSFLLILFYPPQMRDADKSIEDIRRMYKERFLQQSVLRADGRSSISF
jgi:hypothetical protein